MICASGVVRILAVSLLPTSATGGTCTGAALASTSGATPTPAARCGELWGTSLVIAVCGLMLRLVTLGLMSVANNVRLWELLSKWDAAHYIGIARDGYYSEEKYAFFPGLPMLMRALGWLGINLGLAGIIISFLATIALAAGTMELARHMKATYWGQAAAAVAVTCAPASMVFVMPYTEALFGALAMWAIVALTRRKWILAGVVIFFLSFVRLTAVDMIAVFAIMVFIHARRDLRAWAAVVICAMPLVGYLLYVNAHLPQGYFALQKENWHSSFDFGLATLKWLWATLTTSNDVGYMLSTFSILGVVLLLVLSWRKLADAAWLFAAALAANILLSDGLMHSRPRLLLPAAVLFIPWAIKAVEKLGPAKGWALVVGFALFGTWAGGQMLAVFQWAI